MSLFYWILCNIWLILVTLPILIVKLLNMYTYSTVIDNMCNVKKVQSCSRWVICICVQSWSSWVMFRNVESWSRWVMCIWVESWSRWVMCICVQIWWLWVMCICVQSWSRWVMCKNVQSWSRCVLCNDFQYKSLNYNWVPLTSTCNSNLQIRSESVKLGKISIKSFFGTVEIQPLFHFNKCNCCREMSRITTNCIIM